MSSEDVCIDTSGEYISHPFLVDGLIESRDYQSELVANSRSQNTLITLPTGLGKTSVSLLLTAERLYEHRGKSLLLAPTKPLVEQHAEFYREALDIPDENIVVFTGDVRPANRAELWGESTIIIATPQVIENDLVANRISLADVTHITFDECHRATGDYAYNFIADKYDEQANTPLITAMSASPGNDKDEILDVCENLHIENIQIRTEDDKSVSNYKYETDVDWKEITLPVEILEIRDLLQEVIKDRMTKMKEMGIASSATKDPSQKSLNKLRGDISELIDDDKTKGYKAMSMHAEVNKLTRAVQVIESQGTGQFVSYMERNVESEANSSSGSKASKRLAQNSKIQEAIRRARDYDKDHPKLIEARGLIIQTVANADDPRVLVFTESRDTVSVLTDYLSEYLDVQRFVGQSDTDGSKGMSQKEQKEVLEEFREGYYDVLVSTSVAEEGLDVPDVDLVLFYEPVPESVRTIQRKGRTGREEEGRVVVLVGADNREGIGGSTSDETYYWISQRRQSKMREGMQELKEAEEDIQSQLEAKKQTGLDDYIGESDDDDEEEDGTGKSVTEESETSTESDESVDELSDEEETLPEDVSADGEQAQIVVDSRELDSSIPRELSQRDDIVTSVETLEVGDFILSDRVAVERKSVDDFLGSIVDRERDVFQQVKELDSAYDRPVVIIEGDGLYSSRNIHPNAIRGAIASLAVDLGASVLRTEDEQDTTELISMIASREQEERDKTVSLHGSKDTRTMPEQQEYVVSSIADVGPVTAQSLLSEFDTVREIMTADAATLQDAEGVGEVTADRIEEVLTTSYKPQE